MKQHAVIALVLAVITLAVFGRTVSFDFVEHDDPEYVTRNEVVQKGLTAEGVKWVFTEAHGGNWHPVTGLSHMLDSQLFGLSPGGHHATSVLLHTLDVLLLFGCLAYATRAPWRSGLVAALFALHPLHVESVAWISERKDVLSAFFGFLTIWIWIAWTRNGGVLRYSAACLCLALGLMAKPMLVTLPFLLLLLDYWPLERMPSVPFRKLVLEKLPLFVLALIMSLITWHEQKSSGAVRTLAEIPVELRFANAAVSYVRYLAEMFWPSNLAFFYIHPDLPGGTPWSLAQILGACLLMIALSVLAFMSERRWAVVGWLWYVGTLVPVIGLVQVGDQAIADHYTYIPLIGPFIVLAWGAGEAAERLRARGLPQGRSVIAAVAGVVVLACGAAAYQQAETWRNSQALYERALVVSPRSPMILTQIGSQCADRKDFQSAANRYEQALAIDPAYGTANFNYGRLLQTFGRYDEAIPFYERAIAAVPNHPYAHDNLAFLLQQRGDFVRAEEHSKKALECLPEFADAELNLANALRSQGKTQDALAHYSRSLELDPQYAATHFNVGMLLLETGQLAPAVKHMRRAVRLDPDNVVFVATLAWTLATQRDPSIRTPLEAIGLFDRAVTMTEHKDPVILDGLAAANAAAGNFDVALQHAEAALRLAESTNQKEVADKIRGRIALYKERKPYFAD